MNLSQKGLVLIPRKFIIIAMENHLEGNQVESQERSKLIRLIDYLIRLASLRTKLIRDVAEYEPTLWVSSIPREKECFTQAWGREEDIDSDIWIEIQSQREPELPCVPERCENWVERASLRNKAELPELLSEITIQVENPAWQEGSDESEYVSKAECIEDHPNVKQAWERYVEELWFPWTEKHNRWESVYQVYSRLFAIHQEQIRLGEEYELVLGVGLLTWKTPTGQRVCRHLIVANALLEFEARLGKFTVCPMPDGAKVRPELDMLDIEERPARAEETAKSSLVSANDDPWERACIEGVLQGLVRSINSRGEYDNTLEKKNIGASEKPVVEYAPALILRKRSAKGLTETLKKIRDNIEKGGDIPDEFGDIAEIRTRGKTEPTNDYGDTNKEFDGEIFFPKPSNEEQRRIVDKISVASGVLVQGPPGTGKSHTIANLISHLLATGNRILVTAKTPRALQVLMGKSWGKKDDGLVPNELRPLCINLLGSGLEEKRSLELSVGGILRKDGEWNEDRAKRERTDLEGRLRNYREEKAKVNRRIRDIRESETHLQSIAEGTYRGTAAQIVEAVNRNAKAYEWFTDSVQHDKFCTINESDLCNILKELRYFTPEKRRELNLTWPAAVPHTEILDRGLNEEHEYEESTLDWSDTTVNDFKYFVKTERQAIEQEGRLASDADGNLTDLLATLQPTVVGAVQDAILSFQNALRIQKASAHAWMHDALRDILGGQASLWHELFHVTGDAISSIETLVAVADNTSIDFPDAANIRTLHENACKLKQHMENGRKLGWGPFRPKEVKEWLYVIKNVRIDGHSCSTVEHFSILADALRVQIECEKAWGFWIGRFDKTQGPYALQLTVLKSLLAALEKALSIETLIEECRGIILQCQAISEPAWADESQVEKMIASCRLAQARQRKRIATEEIQSIEAPVLSIVATKDAHPLTNELLQAISKRNVEGFTSAISKIRELGKERQRHQSVDEYLSQLHCLLPSLTNELKRTCGEPYWYERLQHIGDAWHWAQARYWIEEYIRQEDVPSLVKHAKQIEDEINAIIEKLASLHAWSFCFSRIENNHRRHMEAWQQSMRRLGKGTGKHAPRHRREAQQHLNQCREAVPAWVMPLHRVWDTVDPAPGMFDLIIVDEASQCGVEAIPLFYLGKKILIVGDDKQISPDAVGLPRDAVHRLMEEFLHDFDFKSSFDVESSLFDHGKLRYGTRRITLREHFRCMPEIIRFSNDLCYSDTPLIPLRQYGPDRLSPIEHIFVNGGYREGKGNRVINRPEADAVVEKIVELCRNSRYSDKTIGVVVLQGEAQGSLIDNQLLERLGAQEMEKRRLVCGNPYSFQGDERDIIILSMVAASNERIGPLTKAADERRFNVAASRARDQMYLFHSVISEDLSISCLRRQLLEFFENKGISPHDANVDWEDLERRAIYDNRSLHNGVKPPPPFHQPGVVEGSWFEVDVALIIHRKGYQVIPQFEIARKHIDLVVEGGQARLAVECYGDRWHGIDRYEADMQRQRQLERCNWEFFTVREAVFYSNQEKALAPLWQMLEERGIVPGGTKANASETSEEQTGNDEPNESDSDETEENDAECDNSDSSSRGKAEHSHSNRRPEEISLADISDAIVRALELCPNYSCTLHSLTGRVLKEVGVLTRGKPWLKFEKRVMRMVNSLDDKEMIEKYKAKNERVRLIRRMA